MLFLAEGTKDAEITDERAGTLVDDLLDRLRQRSPLRRVLLLPPDYTRAHSGAGPLTRQLYDRLKAEADVVILPATGTHFPVNDEEREAMFPGIPADRFRPHDWRDGVVTLGEVPAAVISELSEGRVELPAAVQVDRLLAEPGWDAILSIGQLVPHEVIGIANHVKNVLIGAGGPDLIHKSHWLGAVHGMERIMGRAKTPVRSLLNWAADRFLSHLPLVYLLTVRARGDDGRLVTRGLYAGDDHACFEVGAELCRSVNLNVVERAPRKVVVTLDPHEYKSTWLGNKAIYRTRMAIADGGELIVLAPGVRQFGEDEAIDALIRRFGYRGTPATLAAVRDHPELARNLSAAAHLIHGSSEGRFRITYAAGKISREEIESVGFAHGDLAALSARYPAERLQEGWNVVDGEEIYFIGNPALGLWGTAERFGT
ncbi:MAG: lactate racemase domain-containing protein [Isosphaeraceae bacterium]